MYDALTQNYRGTLMTKKDLSIVIPVLNSALTLESVVQELEGYLRGTDLKFKIVLVNDCSIDSS